MFALLLSVVAFAQEAEVPCVPEVAAPPPVNEPPVIDSSASYFNVEANEALVAPITAWDVDNDAVTLSVSDLPAGATWDPLTHEILWTPVRADVGEHRITVHASDGTHEVEGRAVIYVEPEQWVGGFIPGVGLAAHSLRGGALYWGPIVDVELVSFRQPEDREGPSQGRIFVDLGLLRALEGDEQVLTYGLGFDLSLESNANRRFLIPYAGVSVGNVKPVGEEGALYLDPNAGVWLYTDPTVSVNATCGYGYALSEIEELSGVRCSAAIHWSSW